MFEPKIVTQQIIIDFSANPLAIETIPETDRVFPDWCCRLIHKSSGLQVPGQFTEAEAKLIQSVTKDWDFTVDKERKPRCAARLLQLLEQLCVPTKSAPPSGSLRGNGSQTMSCGLEPTKSAPPSGHGDQEVAA